MAKARGLDVNDFAQTIGRLVRHMRAAAAQHELSLTEAEQETLSALLKKLIAGL